MRGEEAQVYVDGVLLTDAQVMTLRVAVSSFVSNESHLQALGAIGKGYQLRGREVERLLVDGASRPDRLAARRRSL